MFSQVLGRSAVDHDNGGSLGFSAAAGSGGQAADCAGGVALSGTLAQPVRYAMMLAIVAVLRTDRNNGFGDRVNETVVWLALEIVLGLALFVFLIWWTLPRGKRGGRDEPPTS